MTCVATSVLDTGILLRRIRNRPRFRELLIRLAQEGEVVIASYTRLELLRGMREHERERTLRLLDSLITHPLDVSTADLAGNLIRIWQQKGHTIGGPDVVIGATALQCGAHLITTNPRHFPYEDLRVYAVDEEGRVSTFR